ncbi:GNAT family N-acetyltransferase [Mesorhizobium sp. M0817]|uniref:GNAT family N-acetyltransferase n=1 Tax=unclassified Mesorhizobium TaxID=325217 RepID=UPI0033376C49
MDGYDERHPNDRLASNHPLLLMHEGTPVGTARLDVTGPRLGVVRLVAIEANLQRRGLGRILMQEVESYARRVVWSSLRSMPPRRQKDSIKASAGWPFGPTGKTH